jgi:hypothetical protein
VGERMERRGADRGADARRHGRGLVGGGVRVEGVIDELVGGRKTSSMAVAGAAKDTAGDVSVMSSRSASWRAEVREGLEGAGESVC